MRKVIVLLIGFLVFASSFSFVLRKNQTRAQEGDFVEGEILVKFKDGVGLDLANVIHKLLGTRVKKMIPGINVQVVSVNENLGKLISLYAKSGLTQFVEPNYRAYALAVPDDPKFNLQWGMNNTGQTSGKVDADIDAVEAWDLSTGSAQIKIAILDTGIDQNHEDLSGKISSNINFTDSNTVDDLYGHGTHVAGIAASTTNNSLGVAGVGYRSNLLNVKVLNDTGSGAYSWVAEGIIWAADNGAKVINMSLGAGWSSLTLENAVNYAWDRGVVIVAAAGNSNNPSRTYPAYYSNCIAVAATDDKDKRASFSSYGSWVDVAAPGVNIYSTFPNHPYVIAKSMGYDYGSGTSMSTPHVAGLAALVWSTDFGSGNQAVRDRIEQTADPITGTGNYWIWGRINACNAVGGNCSGQPSPSPTILPSPSVSPSPSASAGPSPSVSASPSPTTNPCATCVRGVCNGKCNRWREDATCPDCR